MRFTISTVAVFMLLLMSGGCPQANDPEQLQEPNNPSSLQTPDPTPTITFELPDLDGDWVISDSSGALHCVTVSRGAIVSWTTGCEFKVQEAIAQHDKNEREISDAYQECYDSWTNLMAFVDRNTTIYSNYLSRQAECAANRDIALAVNDDNLTILLDTIQPHVSCSAFAYDAGTITWNVTLATPNHTYIYTIVVSGSEDFLNGKCYDLDSAYSGISMIKND
jgi:hypothetical protein